MGSNVLLLLLQYIGLPAVVATALAWLIKTILKEGLSREADRLREGLHRDTELALEQVRQRASTELESLRHSLTKELEGYKIRFERLQDRRLDLLINLYSALSFVVDSTERVSVMMRVDIEENWDSSMDDLVKDHRAAAAAHRAAYLYLPPTLEKRITKLLNRLDSSIWTYHTDRYAQKSVDEAKTSFLKSRTYDDNPLLLQIATDIRRLLGVEPGDAKGTA